ncbi:MAG: lipopolysaccharide kinase InaA family protein [Prevotellaceae bacterium]|jgi:serine/threonine protein kinase|nr:lipopolysaccharide kinase InaA family protein [Prevotellaceae bacterium]
MKIIINPLYNDAFAGFVRSLPAQFAHSGKQIYKSRNIIKMFDVNGARLYVKSYCEPIFINRLVYTFFRPSKASRAYFNALEVLARGFETPQPIAYIEEKRGGLLSKSYFICFECPYPTDLRRFAHLAELSAEDREILRLVGKLNGQLHNREILHLDFSPGNILYQKIDGEYHFSLLDINRMDFRQVSLKEGCHSFRRLRGSEEMFRIISQAYAQQRGFDEKLCSELILKYNAEHVIYLNKHRKRKQQWSKLWQK